ncbi:MAG: DMT family transporter [Candidatus Nomurabacteria bacterium]|nr:DMT family transporter [Candidatus Nomurabacteria bacterium]
MGILFALTALFSWGLGDFLIQKSARKFGDWIALFYITAFAAIVLFPFVYNELASSFSNYLVLLLIAGLATLFAALLNFEALRIGKISIVEPIYAFEIIVVIFLSTFIIREKLTFLQILLVGLSMIGIFLVSTKSFSHFKGMKLEKGILYAIFGTLCMGIANFMFGLGSRTISPLMINWFTSVFIAVIALVYLASNSRLKEIAKDFKENKRLIFNVSFFDNLAWVMFSFATLYIPIAIATSISEGYIAFASFLGLVFNKEKLKRHQIFGFLVAFVSIIILSIITDK